MQVEEQRLAGDLVRIKEALQKEQARVEIMKEEISQPQWRKVAGEILSMEMEKNVQQLIDQSSSAAVKPWQRK